MGGYPFSLKDECLKTKLQLLTFPPSKAAFLPQILGRSSPPVACPKACGILLRYCNFPPPMERPPLPTPSPWLVLFDSSRPPSGSSCLALNLVFVIPFVCNMLLEALVWAVFDSCCVFSGPRCSGKCVLYKLIGLGCPICGRPQSKLLGRRKIKKSILSWSRGCFFLLFRKS